MISKIKTLIVDDSVVYRTQVRAALENIPEIEIVGVASNGKIAIDRLQNCLADLVILDLEMPQMDGLQTLKEMKRLGIKSKVIVFSSISKRGAEITMEALASGASDFATKPDGRGPIEEDPKTKIKGLLLPKIQALFHAYFSKGLSSAHGEKLKQDLSDIQWDLFRPGIVVIGSSTGGPAALEQIFSFLSGPLSCPIVIAQHMPPLFTATLIERLGKLAGIEAKEAVNGEVLNNQLYIAPGDYHLRLKKKANDVIMELDQGEQINFVRPAVDPLFETAAAIYQTKCLGIILTGMGQDGKIGAKQVKDAGGAIVIQDKASCVVFGMPGAVYNSGFYDRIAAPNDIAAILIDKVGSQRKVA